MLPATRRSRGRRCSRGANEADFVDAQRVFVLADWQYAVRHRQVVTGQNGNDAWQLQRFRYVYVFDESVRHGTTKHLAEKHARKNYVVGKLRLAGALGSRIDFAQWFPDHLLLVAVPAVAFVHRLHFKTVDAFSRRLDFFTTHPRSGKLNRFVYFYVAGASAQIARQRFLDLDSTGTGILFQ